MTEDQQLIDEDLLAADVKAEAEEADPYSGLSLEELVELLPDDGYGSPVDRFKYLYKSQGKARLVLLDSAIHYKKRTELQGIRDAIAHILEEDV